MKDLTQKELDLFKSLIRLGDSKELALKTVLSERERNNNSELYDMAYYS